jgi:copper chaperone NosL
VTKDGKALKFDDVGDLFKYITENTNLDIGEEFVQDRNTKEWLILNKAVLITNTSVRTPMGWGIHAFKTAEEAAKFSASLTNSGNTGTKDKMM